jgi:hypothetical protein
MDMNVILTGGGMVAAWGAVYFSFRAAADNSQQKFKQSLADAIKIGILEARQEILTTVGSEYVTLESCAGIHKTQDTRTETCVEKINRVSDELAALHQDNAVFRPRLVNACLAILSAVQLIAERHPHAEKVTHGLEEQLRSLL